MTITVLLVEDHIIFRAGLRMLLSEETDIQVVGEAGDGASAVESARQLQPDVIVMDITMPDVDGIEATRTLQAESPTSNVLALSIHGESRFVEEMLRAGATGYLLKESAPEELLDAIRTVADGHRYLSGTIKGILLSRYMEIVADGGFGDDSVASNTDEDAVILETKLHRPLTAHRSIQRPRLLESLELGMSHPLTLVSAAAGYGKSTIVSQWLDRCAYPNAWISLDERDNDLRSFLGYFIAAVESLFPESLRETAALLKASMLPPLSLLSGTLINDLATIPTPYIVALDDFHRIDVPAIHELLRELLRRPPQTLHLILITRVDPPLDLLQMRAYRRIVELRADALRLSPRETAEFVENMFDMPVEEAVVNALMTRSEGWITGLHLITLAARSTEDLINIPASLPGERQTLDYLVTEALAHQPHGLRGWLLKTSILDRFCAPLCDALCMPAAEAKEDAAGLTGDLFIQWLMERNLFVVSLDSHDKWFRYHHLFQTLLQGQLSHVLSEVEIADLYGRASHWFVTQGLIDEAFDYAIKAGDQARAAEIVETHRYAEYDADRGYVVERWLERLPAEIKAQRPGLLLAQAWAAIQRFQIDRVTALIARVERLLDGQTGSPMLLGDLHYLRGNIQYWKGDGKESVASLEAALEQVAGWQHQIEYNTILMLTLARSMIGQQEQALQFLDTRIQEASAIEGQFVTHLMGGVAFLHLLAGDLAQTRQQAERLHAEANKRHFVNNDAWSSYLLGYVALQSYDLEQAVQHFAVASKERYTMQRGGAIDALAGLALAQQLLQQESEAQETIERLLEFTRSTEDRHGLALSLSTQARLALLAGDMDAAIHWALAADETTVQPAPFLWLEVPAHTRARILHGMGTEKSLAAAGELLNASLHWSKAGHFTGQVIEAGVLQALVLDRQGQTDHARQVLTETVTLAASRGWIRPFIEAGKPMAAMLTQLQAPTSTPIVKRHATTILSIGDKRPPHQQQIKLLEPVTPRETQILRLLATELSAKEIADELVVTVATVRSHTQKIYQKLGAHSRYEAVQAAQERSII